MSIIRKSNNKKAGRIFIHPAFYNDVKLASLNKDYVDLVKNI